MIWFGRWVRPLRRWGILEPDAYMIVWIAIFGGALLLAGCGKTVTDTACTAFVPIYYSPATDSPETVTQVRQHNAAWSSLCK